VIEDKNFFFGIKITSTKLMVRRSSRVGAFLFAFGIDASNKLLERCIKVLHKFIPVGMCTENNFESTMCGSSSSSSLHLMVRTEFTL